VFVVDCDEGETYESAKEYERLSITSLCCTFVCAYIKLWLAVSLGCDLNKFMENSISNEYR
jgi:hypothetical protein